MGKMREYVMLLNQVLNLIQDLSISASNRIKDLWDPEINSGWQIIIVTQSPRGEGRVREIESGQRSNQDLTSRCEFENIRAAFMAGG
jgi:hypothetical protein